MISNYQVVLDARVLVNGVLRDTLLRLAEPPRLYLPRWSRDILIETSRTLERKLGITPKQTDHLLNELAVHFPGANVVGYESLVPTMRNHPKSHHVLAAAVHSMAPTIVTFNLKDFPEESLAPWNIKTQARPIF